MFKYNVEYDRDSLLKFCGSKQGQVGIIWGSGAPDVVICTAGGRHSKRAGYNDGPQGDGSWVYFGQGASGNQSPEKFANRLLVDGARTVLLFETREPAAREIREQGNYRKKYLFVGVFLVESWDVFVPKHGERTGDELLRFCLLPVELASLETANAASPNESGSSWAKFREKLSKEGNKPKRGKPSPSEYYTRSEAIKKYARWRAQGLCEMCGSFAPFCTKNDVPFLEVHHIHRLADDGPDLPENVAALCPNCHRELHLGAQSISLKEALLDTVSAKENALDAELIPR